MWPPAVALIVSGGHTELYYVRALGDYEVMGRRRDDAAGEAFDKGETFSGVPYEVGLRAVEELKALVPAASTLAQFALRWTLMFDAVTCAIPGARTPDQARANAAAADLPPLDNRTMAAVRDVYQRHVRAHVHALW